MDQKVEKETAAPSGTLAWEIPWTEEPGRLQPLGPQGAGHDCVTQQPQTTRKGGGDAGSGSEVENLN